MTFLVVDEPAEAHKGLLHLLMAIEPGLLSRTEVCHPAVRQLFGRVVEAQILAVRQGVVVDGRLDEVPGDVTLVVAAVLGRPTLRPVLAVGEDIRRLEVSILHLRGQNDGNPPVERVAHPGLSLEDLRVALCVDHERDANGLHRLVHPGV